MKVVVRILILALSLAFATSLSFGQAISGDLVGTVIDNSGAVVPNATVDAVNEATNVKMTTHTNAAGEYRFTNLLPGIYDLTATAQGFNSATVKGFQVQLNKTATAQITLGVGGVSTTVEVAAEAPPIDTTTAQLQTTYETKQSQDLPTASIGLGVLNLSLLQAGVATTGGLGAGTGPSVGGQRPRNNNFEVEGVDNNDKTVTGPLIYVPNDAVSNFTILQNQFSPEFGHSSGGQFNTVVLSGTNNFHGRVYEYFQNRNLNAIDQSVVNSTAPGETPKNPRYDNNRFGGQLGGPIAKNKLFFFANYERNPIGQATVPSSAIYAPTAGGYATLAAAAGANANNINILKQYAVAGAPCTGQPKCPTETINGAPVEVGILPIAAPNYSNFWALTTSMDYNLSDRDQIRGRYIYNKLGFIDTAASLPVFYTNVTQPYHVVALSEYHTFSPTVTNEFRVGYNRTGYNYGVPNFSFSGLDAFPNVVINTLNLNVGPDPNAPQYSIQNLYQAVDNISWVKGKHNFKFGAEGRKYISPQLFIQRSRGDYEWTDLEGYVLDQFPDSIAQRSFGSVGYSGDQYAVYGYGNDTWRIRPNLSLNLGLRYEFTSVPFGWTQQSLNSVANVPGLITFESPRAPKKDFMPRVGFAYSPGNSATMSIRGGFGIGYDVLYDNIGTLARPPQIGSTTDCTGGPAPGCPSGSAGFLAQGGIKNTGQTGITVLSPTDARAATVNFLPNDVKYPQSIQWNFGVQQLFAEKYALEVRYVGTRGIHLNVQTHLNAFSVVNPNQFLPTFLTAPSQATLDALPTTLSQLETLAFPCDTCTPGFILPQYANAGFINPITAFLPIGGSTYHGLQSQLTRRFTNGLQFQVGYTWSHTIDDSTADFFSTVLTPRRPQDFQDLAADRSNSALDRRHRVTISAIYDTPWFKNANWLLRNVLSNYEFAPIYTYQSGEWADVQSSTDANLNGDTAGDRAIFNANGVPGTSSDVTALTNSAGETVAYLAKNPNAQYIRARTGTLPTSSRNTLQMPATNNLDLAVLKRVSLTERYNVEFGFQALNALNHPQFIGGLLNQVNSFSITSTAAKNFLTPGNVVFNNPRASFQSNSRTLQLSAKFSF